MVWKPSISHQTGDFRQSLRWRSSALKPSKRRAQFKQVRMFVISLTTPESADVILGQLIDFSGKLCLSSATQDKWTKTPSDHSLLKAENRDLFPFTPGLKTNVLLKSREFF